MSTNDTKKQMTIEQKDRKNQLAREKRLKNKENLIQLKQKEVMGSRPPTTKNEEVEDDSDDYVGVSSPSDEQSEMDVCVPTTQNEEQENPEEKRKKEISEKRRASLAIARSKIKPKSQITKEKDEEIAKIREENEKLKNETLTDKSRGDHRFGTFQTMRTFLHFGDHGNGLHGPWKFFWFSRDHVVN